MLHFSTKNPINKPVEKDIKKHHKLTLKLTQNSVSFSCQSKQVSRWCINFPHELTCQILTNQSIKIGRRAWPTRDHCEKKQKQLSSLPVMADWTFTFEIKILIVQHISITYFIWFKTKLNLSADNFKKILDLDGWKREPASRSGDTGQQVPCFDSCQLITTLMCNMCTISVFLCYQTS